MTGDRKRNLEGFPLEARRHLGRLLTKRRPQIDPRYRIRKDFAAANGLTDKSVQDVENAYRDSFSDEMIAAFENAYRLAAGSLVEAVNDTTLAEFPRRLTVPEQRTGYQRLGELLIQRRIQVNPAYARRGVFTAEFGLDEALINDVEYGRVPVLDAEQRAAIERAYHWAPGSVAAVLAGGDPTPVDVRDVSGSAYMAATTGAAVTSTASEVVVLDLRKAPEDAPDEVKAYWNGYPVDHRMIWNLPIPRWQRQYLVDHLTAVREALKRARAEQQDGNGDSQAS